MHIDFTPAVLLLAAAVFLFIAAALVALGALGGNFDALAAIGLACFAATGLFTTPTPRSPRP